MDFCMRVCQQILRPENEKNAVISMHAIAHSAISRQNKGSGVLLYACRIEVKARSPRLKAEKEFFDRKIKAALFGKRNCNYCSGRSSF